MSKEVFFSLKNGVTARANSIPLGMACDFECDAELKRRLTMHTIKLSKGVNVLQAFTVIGIIRSEASDASIMPMGQNNCRILFEQRFPLTPWNVVKTILVMLILFFGGAVSILYFHADVDMRTVLCQFYEFATGVETTELSGIGIPYAIGLLCGFLFLLNIPRRRGSGQPTLLDIDQSEYQKQVQDYLDAHGDDADVV